MKEEIEFDFDEILAEFRKGKYTTPRKPNNFIENLIPKRVKLDDK
jgi:hypothetical protein